MGARRHRCTSIYYDVRYIISYLRVCAFVTCYTRCWQHTVNRTHPFTRNKVIIYNNIYARRVWCFSYTYICMYTYVQAVYTPKHISKTVFIAFEFNFRPYAYSHCTATSLSRFLKCSELLAVDDELTRAVAYVVSSLREPLEPQRVKVPIT